jgi:hypothetical protein
MDNKYQELLKNVKEVLDKHGEQIPKDEYLVLFEKQKESCKKVNKLTVKEREKNQKFMKAQKDLKKEHEETLSNLKHELKEAKREVLKYKTILKDKGWVAEETNETEPEKVVLNDDVESTLQEYFPVEKTQEMLSNLINDLAKSILNFQKISVSFFEENKIIVLQRAIAKRVQEELNSPSATLVTGVTNSLLRTHFEFIHQRFAVKILEASDVERGIFKFFEKYLIEDSETTRWNTYAITRFMNEYMSHTRNIARLKHDLVKLDEKKNEHIAEEKDIETDANSYKEIVKARKKVERLIQLCDTKKRESEVELNRMNRQYILLHTAVTKFIMEHRVVK